MTENTVQLPERALIQYRGGGYDGCFWEWNYCVYTVYNSPEIYATSFYDVFSSGRMGITSYNALMVYLSDDTNHLDNDYYIYDLDNTDHMDNFILTSNSGHVLGVAKYLYDTLGIELYMSCPQCDCNRFIPDMLPAGYSGAGGITISVDDLVCEDCNHSYTCENCSEYDTTTQAREINDNNYRYCDACYEYELERFNNDQTELTIDDINYLALVNGHVLTAWHDYTHGLKNYCVNCRAEVYITDAGLIEQKELITPCK